MTDLKNARRTQVDRLPPHAIEAEQGVLGCILLSPQDCIGRCIERLKSADVFYDLRHQSIYGELTEMFSERLAIDIITLQQRLKDKSLLDQIGGIPYLNSLQDAVPSAANLTYYLDIVDEKALLRKLINACTDVVGRVYDYEGSVDELLDSVERDILNIRNVKIEASDTIKQLTQQAIDELEFKMTHADTITGLSTGLIDLDAKTDGMHQSEMITIAGYPSTGKTSLAMQIASHCALHGKIPIGVFSGEMAPKRLVLRALCSEARANAKHIVESNAASLVAAAGKISNAPIHIERASGLTISQIKAKANRMVQQHGIKLFVFDFIQLFNASGDNREQQISNISKGIKSIAMDHNCVCIALSQLTDDGKLKGARAIGEDTDSLWVLQNEGEWQPHIQPINLNIDKCRDGETGKVELTFIKDQTRFECRAKITDDDVPQ